MRNRVTYSVCVWLSDHDDSELNDHEIIRRTGGLSCESDTVLNYAELVFSDECDLRGGFPRISLDNKGKLRISVEVDANRKLKRTEIYALKNDFEGQITDGIGAGCFDDLTAATGLSVQVSFPIKASCVQQEGKAWKPTAATRRVNERMIVAIKKLVDQLDAVVEKRTVKKKSPDRSSVSKPEEHSDANRPNLKKLFRLMAKVDRDQMFVQVKAELEACGNDLSSVVDGELPYGNFRDPKLLRLLLKAGLQPETLDEKGHSLLIQAVANPKSLEILIKAEVDVNCVCQSSDATALIRAARLGLKKSVELLLENGADTSIKNPAGKTARDSVDRRSRDRKSIEKLLE